MDLEVLRPNGKNDPRTPWKWCVRGQIATSDTEVGQTAGNGRIILFRFWQLRIQPQAKGGALLFGRVFEADTGLLAFPFPSQLSFDFEFVFSAG